MSILFLLIILMSICLIVILFSLKPDTVKATKLFLSFVIFTAVTWISFFTGLFTLFPDAFSLTLWNGCWIGLLTLGGITFIYEWKNSLVYAFTALLISLINGGFYLLAKFIASMWRDSLKSICKSSLNWGAFIHSLGTLIFTSSLNCPHSN